MGHVFELTYVEYPLDSGILGPFLSVVTLLPIIIISGLLSIAFFTRNVSVCLFTFCLLSSSAMNEILKRIIRQERPLGSHRGGFGMPSDHSQFAGFTAVHVIAWSISQKSLKLSFRLISCSLYLFIASLIGYSRIFIGVHSIAQVFAGLSVGAAWGCVSEVLVLKPMRHHLPRLQGRIDLLWRLMTEDTLATRKTKLKSNR